MNDPRKQRGWTAWAGWLATALLLYVLSSGPVMAVGFWLREKTHWDGCYTIVFGLYLPLIWPAAQVKENLLSLALIKYIEWWVQLLGTVGPG